MVFIGARADGAIAAVGRVLPRDARCHKRFGCLEFIHCLERVQQPRAAEQQQVWCDTAEEEQRCSDGFVLECIRVPNIRMAVRWLLPTHN